MKCCEAGWSRSIPSERLSLRGVVRPGVLVEENELLSSAGASRLFSTAMVCGEGGCRMERCRW